MKNYNDSFLNLNRILFVVAHPDDFDVYFGGLAAKLVEDKKEVFILLATNGANGRRIINNSDLLGEERIKEEVNALNFLGLSNECLKVLNHKDGELVNSPDLLREIVETIREFRPEVVCTHSPSIVYSYSKLLDGYFINHQDHRTVGLAVVDAVYPYARNPAFFNKNVYKTHVVKNIYFTYDQITHPNIQIDITEVVSNKKKAMTAHKTQFSEKEVDQIITEDNKRGERFYEFGEFINLLV